MNDTTTMRMFLATAALAAVAVLFAGPANAMLQDVGGGSVAGAAAAPVEPGTIPYLSHGIGVDKSQFAGATSPKLTGVHAALARDRDTASASGVRPTVIPYLSHGIGVDESQFGGSGGTTPSAGALDPAIRTAIGARADGLSATAGSPATTVLPHGIGVDKTWYAGQPPLGLDGDSALTRVAAPEPEGLTGDSALTRAQPIGATGGASSAGADFEWTWVGYGGGTAALLAAALTALYLSTRRRGGGVALP